MRLKLFGVVAYLCASWPVCAATISVTSDATLRSAITNAASGDTIQFSNSITLASSLPAITTSVTINGGGFTLDGGGQFEAFVVTAGTVAISNLTIQNAKAQGVNPTGPAPNYYSGGGGGAGMGGALFVGSGAGVTLSSVTFTGNNATGGNGGQGNGAGFNSSLGSGGGAAGSNGVVVVNQTNGGNGSPGGFGGGGGSGGNGASCTQTTSAGSGGSGGAGGFGGGGGGGGNGGNCFTVTNSGGSGGAGGFGGGTGAGGCGANACVAADFGGGGLGAGGAIFVQQGGSLTLSGPLTINGNTVTAGLPGGVWTGVGSAFGGGIFLQGNDAGNGGSGTLTFSPATGVTQTVSDAIADQTGSGGTGGNAGSWGVTMSGAGTLVLAGVNTSSGTLTINAGTVNVTGGWTGPVTVNAGGTLLVNGPICGTVTNNGGTVTSTPSITSETMLRNFINTKCSGKTATLAANITLTKDLPAIQSNMTIDGGGFTLSGNNQFRCFFVGAWTPASTNVTQQVAVSATFQNITLNNCKAIGGSAVGRGGGGAGLGGAIFVANLASVTLSNVSVTGNNASGGSGGSDATAGGGGGGMGGNGGSAFGGGGGLGIGANGGTNSTAGSAGIATGASPGGSTDVYVAGGAGGGGGGGGFNNVNVAGGGGTGGGGGVGGTNASSGGIAGTGGFGGGGGGSTLVSGTGGVGGFGGGGGGTDGTGAGGVGGFAGGGGGGNATSFVTCCISAFGGGNGTTSAGGGGAGMGGGIFIQQGGSLTVNNTFTLSGNTVAAGTGSTSAASAFGSGIFLQGNDANQAGGAGSLTFAPTTGMTQTVSDVIADQTGSGAVYPYLGKWNVTKSGAGTLVLAGTNTSTGTLTISAGTVLVSGTWVGPVTLAAGTTLNISGTVSGTITNNGGTVVHGSAALGLSRVGVNFGSQSVGSPTSGQLVTLSNTGSFAFTPSLAVSGDFAQSATTCSGTLAVSASCTVTLTFTPTLTGLRAGTLAITGAGLAGPAQVRLLGTGISGSLGPKVSLSSTALNFGSQATGTTSSSLAVTLTNTGDSALTVSSVAASGEFAQTNGCTSVAVSGACIINVSFSPSVAGVRLGAITIVDTASGSPHVIRLAGTGSASVPAISFSTVSVNFGNQATGVMSSAKTVTVTNTGSASLNITAVAASGDFAASGCVTPLAAGASCTLSVTFTPAASGTRSGRVALTDTATGSPHVIRLFGTGI